MGRPGVGWQHAGGHPQQRAYPGEQVRLGQTAYLLHGQGTMRVETVSGLDGLMSTSAAGGAVAAAGYPHPSSAGRLLSGSGPVAPIALVVTVVAARPTPRANRPR